MTILILQVINTAFILFKFLMIGYILLSWIPHPSVYQIKNWIGKIVEPYFNLFRFIPPIGMIDISPIVAFIAFNFIHTYAMQGVLFILTLF